MPVPVAARSKAQVYGRQPSEIVGSNPTGSIDVCCKCCLLSGRGLCDGLVTRPDESYRLWRVVVCDQETSYARRLQPRQRAAKYKSTVGCSARRKKRGVSTLLVVTTTCFGRYIGHPQVVHSLIFQSRQCNIQCFLLSTDLVHIYKICI